VSGLEHCTYLLNLPYWYSYMREIDSFVQFLMHCGYLALWVLGLFPKGLRNGACAFFLYILELRLGLGLD